MREPRFVQAAIAVIERRGRYLICRRHRHKTFGGYWEFPGGKREDGESWERCLRRELREELGVRVRAMKPFDRLRHHYRGRVASFRVFRCTIGLDEPKPLASDMLRWVPANRLHRYRFPPANKPLIARLRHVVRPSVG